MKREDKTSQNRLVAELDSLRQELVSLEQRLGEPKSVVDTSSSQKTVSPASYASREQYRDTLEAVPEPIIAIDSGGNIVFNNEKAPALFGFDQGELLGESIESLIPESYRHQLAAAWKYALLKDPLWPVFKSSSKYKII